MNVNWDTVLKAIPVVVAVLTALYRFRDARPRRRATLKADLELLKAAREQELDCRELEARLQVDLSHLAKRNERADRWAVVTGSALALVFSLWTIYLVRDGFSWWAPATGFFAFVGLSIVIGGLADTRQPGDAPEAADGSRGPIEQAAGLPAIRR